MKIPHRTGRLFAVTSLQPLENAFPPVSNLIHAVCRLPSCVTVSVLLSTCRFLINLFWPLTIPEDKSHSNYLLNQIRSKRRRCQFQKNVPSWWSVVDLQVHIQLRRWHVRASILSCWRQMSFQGELITALELLPLYLFTIPCVFLPHNPPLHFPSINGVHLAE